MPFLEISVHGHVKQPYKLPALYVEKTFFSLSMGKWILFLKYLAFNSFLKFYIWECCYVPHWNLVFLIYTICFAQFLHIILHRFHLYFKQILSCTIIADEKIIWLCPYIKEIYVFIFENLILFCFWATF